MLTNNPLLEKHFRKKKSTSKRRELLAIPVMTEAEAETWLDNHIDPADQDVFYGEMITPFTDMNWSYGVTLRQGVKDLLYAISKGLSVAEMKQKERVGGDPNIDSAVLDLPDDEFLIEITKHYYNAIWGPNGEQMSDLGRMENHLFLLFSLVLVLYLYGPKIFIATLLNGIYCQESWRRLILLTKDWDVKRSCGHSVLGYSLLGLIIFNPLYSLSTPVMQTSFRSLVSFFFTVNSLFRVHLTLANDPPTMDFEEGYFSGFQGKRVDHLAHLYGFVNGATLPSFIKLVEKYVFGQK